MNKIINLDIYKKKRMFQKRIEIPFFILKNQKLNYKQNYRNRPKIKDKKAQEYQNNKHIGNHHLQ